MCVSLLIVTITLLLQEVEGSGEPAKAGTVDTDGRKSIGYSPDDEDAVEGSGVPPIETNPSTASQPPKRPQTSSSPPQPSPSDSDDESVEGSGNEKVSPYLHFNSINFMK